MTTTATDAYEAIRAHHQALGDMVGEMITEHAGEFAWDVLEAGPRVWRVRIGRTAV